MPRKPDMVFPMAKWCENSCCKIILILKKCTILMMIYRNTLLSLDIFGIESSIYDISRFLRDRLALIFFQISISLTFHRTSTY